MDDSRTTTSARSKFAMYLKRYHDISVSESGVWRILRRLDLSRLPTSQRYKRHEERWKRCEKQRPGHSVQIDVKFIDPIRGVRKKHYQFISIDDYPRLRVYGQLNRKTAIQFADYVIEKLVQDWDAFERHPSGLSRPGVPHLI